MYEVYLDREVGPVLNAGHRPPLGAGFHRFLHSREIESVAAQINEQAMHQIAADPLDTHPPTPLRVQALAAMRDWVGDARDPRPGQELLRDRETLECELLVFMTGRRRIGSLPAIEWHEVGETVVAKAWQDQVAGWSGLPSAPLRDLTLSTLPEHIGRRAELGKAVASSGASTQEYLALGSQVLAVAMGAALHRAGFVVDAQPGDALALRRGAVAFLPFVEIQQLADGSSSCGAWRARCDAAGIGGLRLAVVVS